MGATLCYGTFKKLQPNSEEVVAPTRDFANPSTQSDIEGSSVAVPLGIAALFNLGSFQADDSGDYAFDAGLTSIKKRVIRRALTSPGAFLHLPATYGVGFLDQVKQLGNAHTRDALASSWEAQIQQEPEVVAASVTVTTDPNNPGLVTFTALVQTNAGTVTASAGFDQGSGDVVSIG